MNKLIFISNSLADIENIKTFAKKNKYSFEYYSKAEWAKMQRHKKRGGKARHLSVVSGEPQNPLFSPTIGEVKEKAIYNALIMSRGNVQSAKNMLGISRATIYRKIQEMDIDLEEIRFSAEEKDYNSKVFKKAS